MSIAARAAHLTLKQTGQPSPEVILGENGHTDQGNGGHNLDQMSRDGPRYPGGSPTVSPTTAAAWVGPPFSCPFSAGLDILLAVIPGAAGVSSEQGQHNSGHNGADQQAPNEVGSEDKASYRGAATAI